VLSSDTDPYLGDHALSGVPILPVVLAFEAVAQVASVLLGAIPRIIDGAVLREAITVPHGQKASIRIAALRRSNEHIDVAIRTASTQFMVDHQRCVVRAGGDEGKLQSSPQELEALVKRAALTKSPLALDPDSDLYGRILFHGNRFQRIRSYRLLNARECVAEIAPTGDSRWFGEYQPGELLLGDPGARDAALHALQACVPHRRVLPVAVGRVELGRIATGVPLLVVARERHRARNTYFYDLEIRDRDGVIERWTRLELRSVEALERPVAWPAPLASSYIEQRVGELLGVSVHVGLVEGGDDRSTRRSAALAAAGIEEDIHVRPDGKPELATVHERHISISHTTELTLAVAARAETGCDIMLVSNLEVGWRNGLSSARVDLVRLLAERAVEELEVSAARVWAAEECLRKVRFQPEMPLLLEEIGEQGTVVLHAGNHRIVTLVEGIGRSAARCVIAISCRAVDPMATFGALSIEAVA
jgi:enediyne polyketide synthase